MSVAWFAPIGRPLPDGWMQVSPHLLASRTPVHALGAAAGMKRKSPTGAAANGMPLNTVTPGCSPAVPWTMPCCVLTGCSMAPPPAARAGLSAAKTSASGAAAAAARK